MKKILTNRIMSIILAVGILSSSFCIFRYDLRVKAAEQQIPETTTGSWVEEGNFADKFAGGTGTLDDPYQISTAAQFARVAYLVNNDNANYADKHYKLTEDIDLSEHYWMPIGTNLDNAFKGTFNGDGKSIKGFYLFFGEEDKSGLSIGGLFGAAVGDTENKVTIENVNIDSGYISCFFPDGVTFEISSLVGYSSYVKIINSHNKADISISGNSGELGPIVSHINLDTTIQDCYNEGNICSTAAETLIGGIAAAARVLNDHEESIKTVKVLNCYNKGKFDINSASSRGTMIGGILCNPLEFDSVSILGCYNEGNIIGEFGGVGVLYSGGIICIISLDGAKSATIAGCYNWGNVDIYNGSCLLGGIVAQASGKFNIDGCYSSGSNTATISGDATDMMQVVGGTIGIIAFADKYTIKDCYYDSEKVGLGIKGIGTTERFDVSSYDIDGKTIGKSTSEMKSLSFSKRLNEVISSYDLNGAKFYSLPDDYPIIERVNAFPSFQIDCAFSGTNEVYTSGSWTKEDIKLTVRNTVENANAIIPLKYTENGIEKKLEWNGLEEQTILLTSSAKTDFVFLEYDPSLIDSAESMEGLYKEIKFTVSIDKIAPTITVSSDTSTLNKSHKVDIETTVGPSGVQKVEVQKDGGISEDITLSYKNGYIVRSNGTYKFIITNNLNDTAFSEITFNNIVTKEPIKDNSESNNSPSSNVPSGNTSNTQTNSSGEPEVSEVSESTSEADSGSQQSSLAGSIFGERGALIALISGVLVTVGAATGGIMFVRKRF